MKEIYLFSISSHPDTINVNSLEINFLKPKIDFLKYDYFIITSKQASKALEQYKKNEYINVPALCISEQSALSYEKLGAKVLETGEGYGDNLISNIKSYPKNTKWLYLRAKIIASDFVQICKHDGYNIDEIVMYESSCSKDIYDIKVKENSILIFTSPSSVDCFLQNNKIDKNTSVIVIGKATAQSLPKDIKYIISEKKTISSCIELAKYL